MLLHIFALVDQGILVLNFLSVSCIRQSLGSWRIWEALVLLGSDACEIVTSFSALLFSWEDRKESIMDVPMKAEEDGVEDDHEAAIDMTEM